MKTFLLLPLAALTLLLGIQHVSAFNLWAQTWDHKCLTHSESPQITEALRRWGEVSGVQDCGVAPNPEIRLLPPAQLAAGDFLGQATLYARSNSVTATYCEIRIRSDQVDNMFVWVHEVGHCLGLAHTDVANSVMLPSPPYDSNLHQSNNGELSDDDIAAIQQRFGKPAAKPRYVRWMMSIAR